MIFKCKPANLSFFVFLLIYILLPLKILAQNNLTLSGNIGWGYYGRFPFINRDNAWNYNQKILSLNLSGHILAPKFLQFSLGGDYTGLDYGEEQSGAGYKNIGYNLQTLFFSGRKVSFGFRFGRKKFDFDETLLHNGYFRTSSLYKGFDLSLSKIKILPTIKLKYTANRYRSHYFQSQDEQENRLALTADKKIGKSFLDMDYRMEQWKNQFFSLDRSLHNFRISDRIEFNPDTKLWLNNIFARNSFTLPEREPFETDSNIFSANFIQRFSPDFLGNAFSSFSVFRGKEAQYNFYNFGTRFNYKFKDNFIISPEIHYLRDERSSNLGEDIIHEPAVGLKLNYQKESTQIRLISTLGILYTFRSSKRSGRMNDLSQYVSLGLSFGSVQNVLASLNYQYSGNNTDVSQDSQSEYPLFTPIGRKQNAHQARIELRSAALRGFNLYLYSQYNKFWREYEFRGKTENRILDNGLTLTTKRTRLTAAYGVSQIYFGGESAEYNVFSLILDLSLFKGLEFRTQRIHRDRKDIYFPGDYETTFESFLRYNLGKISLSAVYRKLNGKIGSFNRTDEILFIRISRAFSWDL